MSGPRRRRLIGFASVFALLSLVAGCATWSPEPAQPTPRGPIDAATLLRLNRLLPAEALPDQFVIQQTVRIRWSAPDGPGEATFDAALQRRDDKLLLLGFGPMQRVGFELWLENGEVRFENRTGREMPFRPDEILADVQRVFYPWLEPVSPCTRCERQGMRLDFVVEERFQNALLAERTFRMRDRPDLGRVRIRYEGDRLFGTIPKHCDVRNEWFGYDLSIESQRLDRIRPEQDRPETR